MDAGRGTTGFVCRACSVEVAVADVVVLAVLGVLDVWLVEFVEVFAWWRSCVLLLLGASSLESDPLPSASEPE